MRAEEMSRVEIEEKFSGMGEYVKMDYLLGCLNNRLDYDTRKFVLVKLAGLYETKRMYSDAGKMMLSAAEINVTFQNKINDFVKGAELFINCGAHGAAESAMKKAIALANDKQKVEINNSVKEFYKARARVFLEKGKRNSALTIYENVLSLDLDDEERSEIRNKLLVLYETLGKIREHDRLKKQIK